MISRRVLSKQICRILFYGVIAIPFVFLLSSCVIDPLTGGSAVEVSDGTLVKSAHHVIANSQNKAIGMIPSQEPTDGFTLYGIQLGESKSSVEEKYEVVACRQDVFFLRCAIILDTKGVSGLSVADKLAVFVAFKDDVVYTMSLQINVASLSHARKMLAQLYGEPSSIMADKLIWKGVTGSVVLDEASASSQLPTVRYSAD